jgi:hypothetical protein
MPYYSQGLLLLARLIKYLARVSRIALATEWRVGHPYHSKVHSNGSKNDQS